MLTWSLLVGAILAEVVGTLCMRAAATAGRVWWVGVASGYAVAFTLLSLVLDRGMPLGVAYGIWAASGVAITAVASKFLFREPFNSLMALGIGLITTGVLMVELSMAHA